jgi:phenylpropionate dioxygenase-like ring-hydroxylating dioxygenase large terminal subunit
MENMLDKPHLPFVHRKPIGRGLRTLVGQEMILNWRDKPYGARITSSVGGQTRGGALDFRFPNAMELFIDPPGRILRLLAVCQPEDSNRTPPIRCEISPACDFSTQSFVA